MARQRLCAAVAAVGMALAVGVFETHAQNSFPTSGPGSSGSLPAPASDEPARPPQAIAPAAVPANAIAASPKTLTGEFQDFGVQPLAHLRSTDQLHGPTPTSIPGARVVDTRQLSQWMQGQQGSEGRVMLLHAIGSPLHLPNAIPAAPASQGGSFDDQVQRDFGDYLRKATGGDRARLIVTYCQGVQCWGSYNAALRAARLGYTNVHWYRGGMEAWQQAGLPLISAQK